MELLPNTLVCKHCKHVAHCGHSCAVEECDHCTECACELCTVEEERDSI